ncbi:TorF family putative porin [Thermomonas flagellata]|uniref:TorF family putative porin n=1 Tax=Thermomonas flagellata TaxID=2888524 RepID=UPI001F039911|nr:TorF family putative porin [Thermomonas flagellata]
MPRAAGLAVGLAGVLLAASAHAGASGSIAVTSDYIYRGITQTNAKPAVQAGMEYAADSGLYLGAWGSSISWLSDLSTPTAPISSSVELDAYGGWRGKLSEALSVDVGLAYYGYPGRFPAGFNSADTAEVYAGATLAANEALSLGAKYSVSVTDLFGYTNSSGSSYLDLNATLNLADGWSVGAHAGRQWIKSNRAYEYTDWKLGVTKAFANGVSLAAAWTDTDADAALYTNAYGRNTARGTLAVTLTKAF